MISTSSYKGYSASIEYSNEDSCFVGTVTGITQRIRFHGSTIEETNTAFRDMIDSYLEICAEQETEPDTPTAIIHQTLQTVTS